LIPPFFVDILIENSPTANSKEPDETLCFQLALVLFLLPLWGIFVLDGMGKFLLDKTNMV
jgi:hypothetical protein